MNASLIAEFASVAKANGLINLGKFRYWAKKHPAEKEIYSPILLEVYTGFTCFGTRRGGRGANLFSLDEFTAFLAANGLSTQSAYLKFRKQQPAEIKSRLPSKPRDHYSMLKA
jgi:hypothetical protein